MTPVSSIDNEVNSQSNSQTDMTIFPSGSRALNFNSASIEGHMPNSQSNIEPQLLSYSMMESSHLSPEVAATGNVIDQSRPSMNSTYTFVNKSQRKSASATLFSDQTSTFDRFRNSNNTRPQNKESSFGMREYFDNN